jgi:hypothetical protein
MGVLRKTNNAKLIYDKKIFVGVDFGVSYCYEHEQGCVDIQNAFGVDRSRVGIDGYKMTKYPDDDCTLQIVRFSDRMHQLVGLYFDTKNPNLKANNMAQYYLPRPTNYTEDEICAAWDNESFGLVLAKSNHKIIDELMSAIKNDDLIIKMGSGVNDYDGGLCLLIASRVPKEIKDEMLKTDRDTQKLYEAVTQTGIAEYLQRYRKSYYSLKPTWVTDGFETERGKMKTKYKVIFFLNPCEQHKYNCGWFTVEELKEWAKNKGPVCRTTMTTTMAVSTLKDATIMEQAMIMMISELKDKIVRDIKETDMGSPDKDKTIEMGEIIAGEKDHAPTYYSAKHQSSAVAKRLRSANTASELLSKIDALIREKAIRSEIEIVELNPATLAILKEYLASI